jgi:GTP-binding protein LepA
MLCESRRGTFLDEISNERKTILKYKLPLAEIIIDFVDKIKSITHGFGSFEYEYGDFERSDIVKVVIHIMN